jgi:hypothetical protein
MMALLVLQASRAQQALDLLERPDSKELLEFKAQREMMDPLALQGFKELQALELLVRQDSKAQLGFKE